MNNGLALAAIKLMRDVVETEGQVVLARDGGFFADECDKAIKEALEKQIHKPVEVVDEPGREFLDYLCPHCKVTLQQKRKASSWNNTVYKYKHCHECGQALRWDLEPSLSKE